MSLDEGFLDEVEQAAASSSGIDSDLPWLVVIGGSAGAIEPLSEILARLPPTLHAAVVVVVHMHPRSGSMLPQILGRSSSWPVVPASDGETIVAGRVYTAVPDHQLIIDGKDRLRVVQGPKESGHRPGVDPLFRSAAASSFRTIAVVLSGGLDDGAAGAAMIARTGGPVVVQDPREATTTGMPSHAAEAVGPSAAVLPSSGIPEWIAAIVLDRDPEVRQSEPPSLELGPELADLPTEPEDDFDQLICPDCGGAMRRVADDDVIRFRCHVGHGWTAEALQARQDEDLDAALWTALRMIEDQISLDERLLRRAQARARSHGAEALRRRLQERRAASKALWHLLTSGPARPDEPAIPPDRETY